MSSSLKLGPKQVLVLYTYVHFYNKGMNLYIILKQVWVSFFNKMLTNNCQMEDDIYSGDYLYIICGLNPLLIHENFLQF